MIKHTPGPWRVIQSRHHAQAIEEWWIDSPTRKAMACLQVWDLNHDPKWRKAHPEAVKEYRETLKEVAANARLIAAAPELLEVLENLKNATAPKSSAELQKLGPAWKAACDLLHKIKNSSCQS